MKEDDFATVIIKKITKDIEQEEFIIIDDPIDVRVKAWRSLDYFYQVIKIRNHE